MYLMSTIEALEKFEKNPRKYLLPPQPAPPCKIVVLGAPLSGSTTLSNKLKERYNCKVLFSLLHYVVLLSVSCTSSTSSEKKPWERGWLQSQRWKILFRPLQQLIHTYCNYFKDILNQENK